MMTIKRLKNYDIDMLKQILNCEKEALIKYRENNELDYIERATKTISRIEKIIDEKTK